MCVNAPCTWKTPTPPEISWPKVGFRFLFLSSKQRGRERKGPPDVIQEFRLRKWLISSADFPSTPMKRLEHYFGPFWEKDFGQHPVAPSSPNPFVLLLIFFPDNLHHPKHSFSAWLATAPCFPFGSGGIWCRAFFHGFCGGSVFLFGQLLEQGRKDVHTTTTATTTATATTTTTTTTTTTLGVVLPHLPSEIFRAIFSQF